MALSTWRQTVRILACAVLAAAFVPAAPAFAAKADAAFTVGNYPVDSTQANAVAAKEKALSDGQQAAFRSLLKRIVPVTDYKQLSRLKDINAAELISGVSVRSERNSSTQYIANLDFTYQAEAVRGLLQSHGIPFVDTQAPAITVVPVSRDGVGAAAKAGSETWTASWKSLDLEHTLTPVKLDTFKDVIHNDTVNMLASGDGSAQRILAGEYKSETVVLAIYEPEPAAKKLHITLAGYDASGPISLKRTYRVSDGDYTYAGDLAALVSLGILEGRWKALQAPAAAAMAAAYGDPAAGGAPVWSAQPATGAGDAIKVSAEFGSLAQWNEIRTQLLETPGLELQILGLSGSNADLNVHYPGGGPALANALGSRGLRMIDSGAGWTLSASY